MATKKAGSKQASSAKKTSGKSSSATAKEARRGGGSRASALIADLMAGGAKAEEALGRLAGTLVDEATLAGDAVPIARTVLEGQPSVQSLKLIRYLLSLGMPGRIDVVGIDSSDADLAKLYKTATVQSLQRAVDEGASTIVACLDARETELRTEAAHLLGLAKGAASLSVERLRRCATGDSDRGVRASATIALGHLARASDAAREGALALASDGDPLLAGLAAVALHRAGQKPPALEDRVEGFFRAFALYADIDVRLRRMSEKERPDWPERLFSWSGGALDVWVFNTLYDGGAPRPELSRGLARAIAPAPRGLQDQSAAHVDWVDRLLGWHFEEQDEPLPALDSLDPMQRAILALLSEDVHNGDFAERGLPPDTRSRRRMLGLDPGSVLERIVKTKGKSKPLWLVIKAIIDEHWNLSPRPPLHAFAQKRAKALGVELAGTEWLDVWFERAAEAYGIDDYKPFPPAEESDAFAREVLLEWSLDAIKRGHADRFELSQGALGHAFAALARALPKGEAPPAWSDELYNFSGRPELAREGFARFPPERRERIAERALKDPRAPHAERVGDWADLAPKAAARVQKREIVPARARVDDARFLEHVAAYPQLRRAYVD